MIFSSRNRKRILIFIAIPVLALIPLLTDDIILRIISAVLIVIYVGFIIFLRDSIRVGTAHECEKKNVDNEGEVPTEKPYDTDDGENFKIISPAKKIEVITSENYTSHALGGKKDFFKPPDLKDNFAKIASEELPSDVNNDEQFSFVLEKILNVAKEAYVAHTAVYFWYNKSKSRLTLEKYISSSSDITERKFDLEDDVLSKIVLNEEPELLTDISSNAERDVIRYYNNPQGIKSFVGVPLFYGKNLSGVLALDSKVADAYGIETIYSLGRFVRVISIIISLFEKKFTETQSEERLNSLLAVFSGDKKFSTENDLYSTLEHAVRQLISWDAFTFVYYNPNEQKFKTSKIINNTSLKYIGENLEVELSGTLVGKSIISGIPVKIDDTSMSELSRFSKTENVSFDGSFLAIPLIHDEQNYGVLCFESLKKSVYTNADVNFLKNATKIFAFMIYSFSSHSILKGLLSVDVETRALNHSSFIDSLCTELIKANDLNVPGALALIKIDDFLEQESLFEGDPFPKVLKSISQMIKDEMSSLNIFGRLSERIFGIYFFNTPAKDVFLWAEKLRIKIARKPIAVISKQTTFTVSIGVASTFQKTDADELIHNAELALGKALEKGGNAVKNIN